MNRESSEYDVIVIGGGIQGAGAAQLFALNGYSVLLLEQFEFASQTSSRSSKLIHGGLRYLESLQFGLVKTCLRDREILLNTAPDLVSLERFYIPVYQSTSRSRFKINLGLWLYSLLGGFRKSTRFKRVPRKQWLSINQDKLNQDKLLTVFQYYDARTDDRQLTLAVLDSARQYGAHCLEHAKCTAVSIAQNHCQVSVDCTDKTMTVSGKLLINAAGPWVNQVMSQITPHQVMAQIDLVKGTHIELDHQLHAGMYYVEAPLDRRAVFIMPYQNRVLVGTTEKVYTGDPAKVKPDDDEIEYLLKTVAFYFPEMAHCRLLNSYAGLRVLPKTNQSAFSRSRETMITANCSANPRLISVYGGKLTSYRSTAEKIMQLARPALAFKSSNYVHARNVFLG